MKILRTANLGSNFTGSYEKGCILQRTCYFSLYICLSETQDSTITERSKLTGSIYEILKSQKTIFLLEIS